MRIDAPRGQIPVLETLRRELVEIAGGRLEKAGRPCPECAVACPCSGSSSCACACSPSCREARRQLSSEPEKFPIEAGIRPLVYALNTITGCQTIWSCEGHEGPDGGLYRLPAVWFYPGGDGGGRPQLLPLLLSDHLAHLERAGKLSCRWQIRIGSWSRQPVIAYGLEPHGHPDSPVSLKRLHNDIEVIASRLAHGLRQAAERWIRLIDEDQRRDGSQTSRSVAISRAARL